MKNKYHVEPLKLAHVDALRGKLRRADHMECLASGGLTADKALEKSFRYSTHAWAGMVDDRPIVAFGVVPFSMISDRGSIWFLATKDVETAKIAAVRFTREYVKKMLETFAYLHNWVDNRNKISIRWIEWAGFKMEKPAPYGIEGKLFRHFWLDRENYV